MSTDKNKYCLLQEIRRWGVWFICIFLWLHAMPCPVRTVWCYLGGMWVQLESWSANVCSQFCLPSRVMLLYSLQLFSSRDPDVQQTQIITAATNYCLIIKVLIFIENVLADWSTSNSSHLWLLYLIWIFFGMPHCYIMKGWRALSLRLIFSFQSSLIQIMFLGRNSRLLPVRVTWLFEAAVYLLLTHCDNWSNIQ